MTNENGAEPYEEAVRHAARDFATSKAYADSSNVWYHIGEIAERYQVEAKVILPLLQSELKLLYVDGRVAKLNAHAVEEILVRR